MYKFTTLCVVRFLASEGLCVGEGETDVVDRLTPQRPAHRTGPGVYTDLLTMIDVGNHHRNRNNLQKRH